MNHLLVHPSGAGLAAAVLLILLAAGAGCRTLPSSQFDPYATPGARPATVVQPVANQTRPAPGLLTPGAALFTLGPGDVIDIELLGRDDEPVSTLVCPDGRIYYHLLPGLDVWGKTLAETRQDLEAGLREFLRNPEVVVSLRKVVSKRVWLLGRLSRPGIYPLDTPMTVVEAIVKAGGLESSRFTGTTEALADLHHSFLIRDGEILPVNFHRLLREGDLSHNVYLRSDDYIYVPSALSQEVFVLGAVREPRSVGFKEHMTLASAIAIAEGTIEHAHLSHVAIVRGSLVEPSIAIVDYAKIIRGEAPDVLLEPRDIVHVPLNPYRKIGEYAGFVVNSFVRTVAANEGARVIDPDAPPASINIGISE